MRHPTRHLHLIIVLSILVMLSLLGIWLTKSFFRTCEEAEIRVVQTLEMADLQELFFRTQRYQQGTSLYFFLPQRFPSTDLGDSELRQRHITLDMQRTLHQSIDSWLPLNAATTDSLLRVALQAQDILVDYELTLYDAFERDTLFSRQYVAPCRWPWSTSLPALSQHADTLRLDEEGLQYYILRHHSVLPLVAHQFLPTLLLWLGGVAMIVLLLYQLHQHQQSEQEMTDFARNLTHELKTPIAVALAAHEALLDFGAEHDAAQRTGLLHTSRRQLTRLAQLVEQALAIHRGNRQHVVLHPQPINLPSLLRSLQAEHELKAEKPLHLVWRIVPDNLSLTTDATHLYNILSNLVDNAVKYSPQQAEVEIEVRRAEEPSSAVVLSVRDHGMGIPRKYRRRVWQRFFRIPQGDRQEVRGNGLGLFYVRTMVEHMGGHISLDSIPGSGTTFTLTLPQFPPSS